MSTMSLFSVTEKVNAIRENTMISKMENLLGRKIDKREFNFAANQIKKTCYSHEYSGEEPWPEVVLWCEDSFGNNYAWSWNTFYFKNESDLSCFLLRWM